jgi:hypothetical protein
MPGNRRVKYLGKCILKGVYVGGLHAREWEG